MKNSEILALSKEDLVAAIAEEKANLRKLKFAHAVSAIENPNRIRYVRRTIARLNTELTARKEQENQQSVNEVTPAAEA